MTRFPASLMLACAGALLVAAAPPAAPPQSNAQSNAVKTGVDAWSRGDYAAAVAAWRGPAEQGDADAQFNLGQAYKLGRGVTADPKQAETWYGKAAQQGHYQAEENYGLSLFQNGDRAAAAPWLEKAAMRGAPRAQLIYGTMLFNGDGGLAKDWVRAYALLTRASGGGLPQAGATLAEMDKFIPEDQRRKGLELAQQYQVQAQRPQLPPDVLAAAQTKQPIRTVPVPPSSVTAPSQAPGASYPIPGTKPAEAPAAETPAAVARAPVATPTPTPAASPEPAARPAPQPTGRWRIQLGAFSNEGNARRLWSRLRPRVGVLGNRQSYLVHAGSIVRLQAGPFASSGEAASACRAVKAKGNDCLTVAP